MIATRRRFEFALKGLRPSEWEHFEELCSAFLAAEFPGLRTTASKGGDEGRDAELFRVDGAPGVIFQFSVREKWKDKIRETLKRVGQTLPEATALVFVSNQEIGAAGDGLKREAREQGYSLDIRDRAWFLERVNADDSRQRAADDLAKLIVDPLLSNAGALTQAPALRGQEARTALVYLEMQSRDENASKGLTKSSFEALVRCALRGTSSNVRRSAAEVRSHVHALLPQHRPAQLNPFIDAALARLSRGPVKRWPKEDTYHLSYDEEQRTKDRIAGLAMLGDAFQEDVEEILRREPAIPEVQYLNLTQRVRSIIESYFYKMGEEFAQCVVGGLPLPMHQDTLWNTVLEHSLHGSLKAGRLWRDYLLGVCTDILTTPSESTNELLRLLYTSYTLFAFLSEVPDVQRATKRLFAHGSIWLDTSALLPLLTEQAEVEDARPFTTMLVQLNRLGTKLKVTEGVLEEIERNINLCRVYLRKSDWTGRVPYLVSRYVMAGRPIAKFAGWLENFAGYQRPTQDIADFLLDVAGIEVSAPPPFDRIKSEVQTAIRVYWQEIQDKRRGSEDGFNIQAFRLAEHDIENYLAALAERRLAPGASVYGYSSWLLTIDSAAWALTSRMEDDIRREIGFSPVISLDFLFRYLSFGPRRDEVDTVGTGFSRIFTLEIFESVPADLIEVADQVRRANVGRPERIIQRMIRDELDKQKATMGAVHRAGLDASAEFRNHI